MESYSRKLLTIVTEAVLESSLVQDLERLGAHGYTITDARGKGHRGARSAGWGTDANIRLEVVCDEATAEVISAYAREHYYENYAMILFISDVSVLRPEKF